YEDVRRLDVTMNDPVHVSLGDRGCDGRKNAERAIDAKPTIASDLRQERLALAKIHHETKLFAVRIKELANAPNPRMHHDADGQRLATESLFGNRVVRSEKQLQRNPLAPGSIEGLPNFAHATGAKLLTKLEAIIEDLTR